MAFHTASEVNQQGIPISYLDEIANVMGKSRQDIEELYAKDIDKGIDFKELVNEYTQSNPYGITLKDAHLISGYTSNFFMKKSLGPRLLKGTDLSEHDVKLTDNINQALDKLPAESGTFYRGLGFVPEWFDTKYAVGEVITESHFASVSKELSPSYPSNRVIKIEAVDAKDISDLAMDVSFADKIGQVPTKSEHVIKANSTFLVASNDGVTVTLRQIK